MRNGSNPTRDSRAMELDGGVQGENKSVKVKGNREQARPTKREEEEGEENFALNILHTKEKAAFARA